MSSTSISENARVVLWVLVHVRELIDKGYATVEVDFKLPDQEKVAEILGDWEPPEEVWRGPLLELRELYGLQLYPEWEKAWRIQRN